MKYHIYSMIIGSILGAMMTRNYYETKYLNSEIQELKAMVEELSN